MSAWEDLGSTYVESITNVLPIHRMIVFAFGFVGSLCIEHQQYLSICESIARINLSELSEFKSDLLKNATILNIFWGALLVSSGWAISRLGAIATFSVAAKAVDLKSRSINSMKKSSEISSMTIEDKRKAIDIAEGALEKPGKKMKSLNSYSEGLLSMGLASLVAAHWGNALDILLGISLLIAGATFTVKSVIFFLSEYYGQALFIAQLRGKSPPPLP
jgi:hypothetical protein